MLMQATPFAVAQRDAAPPAPGAARAVSEHLAWRYGLTLMKDSSSLLLLDGDRGVRVDGTDNDVATMQGWLRNPLERDGGDPEGTLGCPLDDLERIWLDRHGLNSVPKGQPATFRVWLSHDIDQLQMSYRLLSWTMARLRRGQFREASELVSNWMAAHLRGSNPFWNLDHLLRIEQSYGVHATYFFLHQRVLGAWWSKAMVPFRYGLYSMSDPAVQQLVRDVHSTGAEIGVHGSLCSAREPGWLKEEIDLVARCGLDRPHIARQHWLDFDLWDTVDVFAQAGIQLDSSIGFNAPGWGFRMRTAWPHRLPAARSDALSSILHVTPCLQDGALTHEWRIQLERLLRVARDRHATLPVVWHNTAMLPGGRGTTSYEWFIERATELGATFVVGQDLLSCSPVAPLPT
jgi:peptidoglycan/xylan/chitin deacetylase (PgdA/CDA1 family)